MQAPKTIAERMAASRLAERERDHAEGEAGDRADAGGEPVEAVEEVDHVHDRDDPERSSAGSRPRPAASWMPRNGKVKRSTQTPNAGGTAAAATWPPSFSHQRRPRKSSTAPTVTATRGAEQEPAHLAAQSEERERGHEDAEEEREAAEARHGRRFEPPPAGPVDDAEQPRHPADRGRQQRRRRRARRARPRRPRGGRARASSPEPVSSAPTSSRRGGRPRRRGPGRCKPRSFRPRVDRRRQTTCTSGVLARCTCAIPSGAATRQTSVTVRAPAVLRAIVTAAAVELPVASIGSSTITSRSARSAGSLT